MSWINSWIWPKVDSRRNAQNAIEEGFWAACFVSMMAALFLLIEALKNPEEFEIASLLGVVFFALIAFGIRRRSRAAALAGCILYISDRVYVLISGAHGDIVLPALITLALLNAVRGTLAYHRFPPLPANMPSIEESFRAIGNSSLKTEKDEMPGAK